MDLSRKLTAAFWGMGLLAAVVGAVGIANIVMIGRAQTTVYAKAVLPLQYLARMGFAFQRSCVALRDLALETDAGRFEEHARTLEKMNVLLDTTMREYAALIRRPEDAETFGHLRQAYEEYLRGTDEIVSLVRRRRLQEVRTVLANPTETDRSFGKILDTLIDRTVREAAAIEDRNSRLATVAIIAMVGVILSGFVGATLVGRLIARFITRPLHQGVRLAEAIARGDLTVRMDVRTGDELQTLAEALNTTVERLAEMFQEIQASAQEMAETNQTMAGDSPAATS